MDPTNLIQAGRCPRNLLPWNCGEEVNATEHNGTAFLFHVCMEGLHRVDAYGEGYGGYTVMDDSDRELKRHFQGVRHATGRVLKTGLGFGCFVRMCLTKSDVEHIDVVEIDPDIVSHFGAQFQDNPRVTIHCADAFEFDPGGRRWNFAWHDIYTEGNNGLSEAHTKLIMRYLPFCDRQGAWQFPRAAKKQISKLWPGLIV